jgi:hypothetical protein
MKRLGAAKRVTHEIRGELLKASYYPISQSRPDSLALNYRLFAALRRRLTLGELALCVGLVDGRELCLQF